MHDCCEIFGLSYTLENRENCMKCLEGDEDRNCCYEECFAEQSGIFKNDTFDSKALLFSITRGEQVEEEFVKITQQSIIKCPEGKTKGAIVCGIPTSVYVAIQCVLTQNYINCPKVAASTECQSFKALLAPCKPIKKKPVTMMTTPRLKI